MKEIEIPSEIKSIFIPEEYQKDFELKKVKEIRNEWHIDCRERPDKVPVELEGGRYKLNGYVGKTEVITFPIRGKAAYIHFYRRKWKNLDTGEIMSNSYQLHPEGMKATKEFGDFLKELTGQERSEFYSTFPNLRLGRE